MKISEFISRVIQPLFFVLLHSIFHFEISFAAASNVFSNEDKQLWNSIQSMIVEPSKFDATRGIALVSNIENADIMNKFIGGKPLVHHLLNIYWTTNQYSVKSKVASMVLECISKGVSVDAVAKGEPSALFKSLMIKELSIAASIAEKSDSSFLDLGEGVFTQLFSLPCNPTPTTKLLLHASSIFRSSYSPSSPSNASSQFLNLLHGARLDGPATTVGSKDLELFSPSFRSIIAQLSDLATKPDRSESERAGVGDDVQLVDIMAGGGEVADFVFNKILKNAHPTSIANQIATTRVGNRNDLHLLAMSGASSVVHSIVSWIRGLENTEKSIVSSAISAGLMQLDARQNAPLVYCYLRFGMESLHFQAFQELYSAAGIDAAAQQSLIDAFLQRLPKVIDAVDETVAREATKADFLQSGGWSTAAIDPATLASASASASAVEGTDDAIDQRASTRCDILQMWGPLPSPRDFFEKYVSTGTPVVFRGAALGTPIRNAFKKKNFIQKYGKEVAPVSVIPYAGSFGISSTATTLKDVANFVGISTSSAKIMLPVEAEVQADASVTQQPQTKDSMPETAPEYVFTVSGNSLQEKLKKDAPVPGNFNIRFSESPSGLSVQPGGDASSIALQFYLGPPGSGAPMHFHGHAVNTLAYGEKKWYMFPPAKSYYMKTTAVDFIRHDSRVNASWQCTQFAGDVMFVPTLWGHATLNVKQSIGVAHEFSVEPFCME